MAMNEQASRYADVYARWQRDPEEFWADAAREIDWYQKPERIFDPSAGVYGRWFTDGVCNTCWNAVDRHVMRGRGPQPAIVYDSPLTGTKRVIAYDRLWTEVQILAAVLRDFGVERGDRVVLYMPMVPEAVFGMLACARLGAIHSVVFGGFAPRELAIRIDDAKPKVILSASCGIEGQRVIPYKPLLDDAIGLAGHQPDACLILQRPQAEAAMTAGRDHDWASAVTAASPADCVWCRRPIRSTSSTPPAPPACRRASCATTAATRWRCSGRCRTSTARGPATSTGRPPTSAGWSAT